MYVFTVPFDTTDIHLIVPTIHPHKNDETDVLQVQEKEREREREKKRRIRSHNIQQDIREQNNNTPFLPQDNIRLSLLDVI